jgi:hypothetical protein
VGEEIAKSFLQKLQFDQFFKTIAKFVAASTKCKDEDGHCLKYSSKLVESNQGLNV